jgi:hypothetical protein
MSKINHIIKLNNQVEVKSLLIQLEETLESDLSISLEGRRDAFHAKGNEWTIFLELRVVCPYKRYLNA